VSVDHSATVTSLDGRQRPATQTRPPASVDTGTGEVLDAPTVSEPKPRRNPLPEQAHTQRGRGFRARTKSLRTYGRSLCHERELPHHSTLSRRAALVGACSGRECQARREWLWCWRRDGAVLCAGGTSDGPRTGCPDREVLETKSSALPEAIDAQVRAGEPERIDQS